MHLKKIKLMFNKKHEVFILINYYFNIIFSFKLTESKEYIQNFHLPQQHLRNLARKGSRTKYVFLTDIDILPSAGLAKGLSMFLKNSHCYKCAYVIIPYELDSSVKFPSTKNELKQLAAKKHARLYHSKVYPPNQHATNVSM